MLFATSVLIELEITLPFIYTMGQVVFFQTKKWQHMKLK